TGQFKRDCHSGKKNNANAGGSRKGLRTNPKTKVDEIEWWIDSSATTHVCKDRCWFKTFEPVKEGSVLYMGDEHFAPVHGKGNIALKFSSGKTITLFNVLYGTKLRKNLVSGPVLNKCGCKQKKAVEDEIGSIMENNSWVLSDLPPGCKPLGFKWIFKRKMKVNVARITTIRLLLALAVVHNLVIHQMNAKTTFLNGDLDENLYMKQSKGFVMPGEADVILGIKTKRENKGIVITLSHYTEKILKKFNHEELLAA
nr:zinc finger, CCHC-type [Tanacetum cinerariifolium]